MSRFLTAFSGSVVQDGRVLLATIAYVDEAKSQAAWINLSTGQPIAGIRADSPCESQRRVINRVKHADTVNYRHGSFALATLGMGFSTPLRYGSTAEFVRKAEVGHGVSKAAKAALISALDAYYGWTN